MDDATDVCRVFPLASKDKAAKALREYHGWMRSYGYNMQRLKTDNEPVLTGGEFDRTMDELGIRPERPPPYCTRRSWAADTSRSSTTCGTTPCAQIYHCVSCVQAAHVACAPPDEYFAGIRDEVCRTQTRV